MASSRGSTASSKPPKQRLAVTAQSATSKPWFTCSQPNSISCFQTEIVATHAKQRRTIKLVELPGKEVGAGRHRLNQESDNERALGTEPVTCQAEHQSAPTWCAWLKGTGWSRVTN